MGQPYLSIAAKDNLQKPWAFGGECDCPQLLLSAPPHIARKGEREGGTFDGFPHSCSITRPQATGFALQNRTNTKKDTLLRVFFRVVRRLQFGYFALESLYRNGLQISGKKYSQFF